MTPQPVRQQQQKQQSSTPRVPIAQPATQPAAQPAKEPPGRASVLGRALWPRGASYRLLGRMLRGVLRALSIDPELVRRQLLDKSAHARALRILVWLVCILIVLALWALTTYALFAEANGAIQETSLAAMGCFQVMVAYVISRAIDSLTRAK
jgi:type VI protein secretion system component VasK